MKTYCIYNTSTELPEAWDTLVPHDVFLQVPYLKALEEAAPKNIHLFYMAVFNEKKLVGIAVVQRVQLYLRDMFRQINIAYFKEFFRNTISKIVKGNILVVGNLTHTGQHAMYFNPNEVSRTTFLGMLFSALDELKLQIKQKEHKKIRAIMFKDFFEHDPIHSERGYFTQQKFSKVMVQPNMLMPIRPNWSSNMEYVNDFTKKYRDRYKRARKKLNGISCSELNEVAIRRHAEKLYKLYLNVSNNAKFNTFILPENHFYSLKKRLNERFKVFGYFLGEELIGFFTLILNGKELETYFLGYDDLHQYPNQLYLNMLYDMARFAIENNFKTVVYARTAMEIKSSVGAEPKPMVVYVKHTNTILNSILRQLFGLMDPTPSWEERHPFKNKV